MSEMGDMKFTTAGDMMMRYFSYNVYDPDHKNNGYVRTVSESDIRLEYWDFWYDEMCKKFGKANVDTGYTWQDCIEDFIVTHWAWKVDEENYNG